MTLEQVSRDFLKLHKVYRYRMKKVCDMSAAEVIQACHWYCTEHSLLHAFECFRDEKEDKCFYWAWDYPLADAKITDAKMCAETLVIDLDCSWTVLHPSRYIKRLLFQNCTIQTHCDLTGAFWFSERVIKVGSMQRLELTVTDAKNRKHFLEIQFSHVSAEK